MPTDQELIRQYASLGPNELAEQIADRKKQLGSRLCILGHHYQTDEVIRFADFRGDSLKLSQLAGGQEDAEYIVFCGVHFMAESADILSADNQTVCLPNMRAGCAMADMADNLAVESALEEVAGQIDRKIVPISYVNSTAAIKSVTARHGGACCTSSNVRNVFEWALADTDDGGAGADKVFCIPDQHLGRNTAVAMGYSLDDCVVYDPTLPDGGLTREQIREAKFILWKGHCYVHQLFLPDDVKRIRDEVPGVYVIVHPEAPHEVVQLADAAGSTSQIIAAVEEAEPGSRIAIGTEMHLVNRLANQYDNKEIHLLSDRPAACIQMARIDLPHLLWVLDGLVQDQPRNPIRVPEDIAADARIALQRMIDIRAVSGITKK